MKKEKPFLWALIGGIVAAFFIPIIGAAVQTYVLPTGSTGERTEMLTNGPNRDEAQRSSFSGTSAPSSPTPVAGQLWFDTANDFMKFRNAANDAWRTLLTTSSSILTSQLTASASCASGYTDVRGWCIANVTGSQVSTLTTSGSFTTWTPQATAKIAMVQIQVALQQDGTGEAAGLSGYILNNDESDSTGNSQPRAFVQSYLAGDYQVDQNTVILRAGAGGSLKYRCTLSGGPVTTTQCTYTLLAYMP